MSRLILPERASTIAGSVDAIFWALTIFSGALATAVAVLIVYYAIRYRRRHAGETGAAITGSYALEIGWSLGFLGVNLIIFFWSASVFFRQSRPPADASQIYVVGRQWMWKFQHQSGQREINELHVPVGRPVRLTMTSEDVIHSFFVPAFRAKMDVIPGRYTEVWFEATRPGSYHLFCTEYCGTKHSAMIGKIIVMEPHDFQAWLGGPGEGSLASAGERLFRSLGCATCHSGDARARGPDLAGLFGKTVELQDGRKVTADESYLRESIVRPGEKIVAGFQAIMPAYEGQIDEEGLVAIIAYLKSLGATQRKEGGQ